LNAAVSVMTVRMKSIAKVPALMSIFARFMM
jgi:hypothetical protein